MTVKNANSFLEILIKDGPSPELMSKIGTDFNYDHMTEALKARGLTRDDLLKSAAGIAAPDGLTGIDFHPAAGAAAGAAPDGLTGIDFDPTAGVTGYGYMYRIIEFNKENIKKIDNTISNMDLQLKKSVVNKQELTGRDPNLRISKTAWIRESNFCKSFYDIGQKINELCHWNFDIKDIESIQYGIYSDGGKYDWHVDQGSTILLKGGSVRKISMTLFMNNPDEYEGGEFDLELFDPEKKPRYETFKLKKGSAIFFHSNVWHRVRPVSSGVRKSLVAWYSGPPFK